jgi:hypothetical protein
LVPDPLVGGVLEGLVWTVVVTLVVGVAVIVAVAWGEVWLPLVAVARFVTLPFERSLAVIV